MKIKFAAGLALLLFGVTGCVSHQQPARQAIAYPVPPGPPPPDYVETQLAPSDDYTYYPVYEVYYSNLRREYVYVEHESWVARSTPPRLVRGKLLSSPSVRLDFKDSPSLHHTDVIEQYPKNWLPKGEAKESRDGRKETHDLGHE